MKKNKVFLFTMLAFLIIGIATLIVGFVLSGVDILAFLQSNFAIWIYVALGIWAIALIIYLIKERIKKL